MSTTDRSLSPAGAAALLRHRAQSEFNLIASALATLPVLSRAEIGESEYPANGLASSEAVEAAIDRIVRRRLNGNSALRVHFSLLALNGGANEYAEVVDAFRDAAFLVGYDYAQRSMPDWWAGFSALDASTRGHFETLIWAVVRGGK